MIGSVSVSKRDVLDGKADIFAVPYLIQSNIVAILRQISATQSLS